MAHGTRAHSNDVINPKPRRVSQFTARAVARDYLPFDASACSGRAYPEGATSWQISQGMRRGKPVPEGVTYIVYSYDTPIAWVEACGRAVVTDETYSKTTSCRHMPVARSVRDRPDAERAEVQRRNADDAATRAAAAVEALAAKAAAKVAARAARKEAREEAKRLVAQEALRESAQQEKLSHVLAWLGADGGAVTASTMTASTMSMDTMGGNA